MAKIKLEVEDLDNNCAGGNVDPSVSDQEFGRNRECRPFGESPRNWPK